MSRNTIRAALRSSAAPRYSRLSPVSKLDPFKEEVHRLLKADPRMPGQRIRELLAPLGFDGGKTIVDDYLREVRPLFDPPRTFQRTVYRPGEICQFDVWEPAEEIPVGHGQTRKGWVVLGCLGYSRAGAGALIFSRQTEDLLFGIWRCLWSLGALPQTLVWDRQAGLHAGGGRPTQAFAAFCGALKVGWHFCDAGDPQAKGVVERLQDFAERSFEPGRVSSDACRRGVRLTMPRIRVVVATPGLDGHDRGAKIIARALRDAGMEVIYTGLHQTPEQIVETVLQEDADAVGLSILSGAHMTLVPRIVELLAQEGADDVLVVLGGTIPGEDIVALEDLGVAAVFTPGAPTEGIIDFIRSATTARA
jgi:methylmalonyl-CoA mutase C-terminal domain/subunit